MENTTTTTTTEEAFVISKLDALKASTESALVARLDAQRAAERENTHTARLAAMDADTDGGRALLELAYTIAQTTLKHAADPQRKAAQNPEYKATEADAARRVSNGGMNPFILRLRALAHRDAAAMVRYIKAAEAAEAAKTAAELAGDLQISAEDAEKLLKYCDKETLSDAADIIQTAAAAILDGMTHTDDAPGWLEAEYTTLQRNKKVLAQGKTDAPTIEKTENTMRRAHAAAREYVDSMRGVRTSRERALLYDDFSITDADGTEVSGLDYVYRNSGRFAALAGEDASGTPAIGAATIEKLRFVLDDLKLSPVQTDIVLKYAAGRSYHDIAESRGTTRKTVKIQHRRAAEKAAARLETVAAARAQTAEKPVDAAALAAYVSRFAAHAAAEAARAQAEAEATGGRREKERAHAAARFAEAAARYAETPAARLAADYTEAAEARAEAAARLAHAARRFATAPAEAEAAEAEAAEAEAAEAARRLSFSAYYKPAAIAARRAAEAEAEAARIAAAARGETMEAAAETEAEEEARETWEDSQRFDAVAWTGYSRRRTDAAAAPAVDWTPAPAVDWTHTETAAEAAAHAAAEATEAAAARSVIRLDAYAARLAAEADRAEAEADRAEAEAEATGTGRAAIAARRARAQAEDARRRARAAAAR